MEYRRAEDIVNGAGRVLLRERDGHLFVHDILADHQFLAVELLRHTVQHLDAGYIDGRTVGDVIAFIPSRYKSLVGHAIGMDGTVAEVEHLGCLSFGEEGGIAVRRCLYHFVTYREEVGGVLARLRVGIDGDALFLIERVGHHRVAAEGRIGYAEWQTVYSQVFRHTHDMRGVVAFELEYQLDIVAKVIGAQSEAERFGCLVLTARDASGEAHFRYIPDAYAVQRGGEGKQAVAVDTHPSAVFETMSLFGGAEGEGRSIGHADGKVTGYIGPQHAGACLHGIAVEEEEGVAHGDRGVLIEHPAAEAHR